MRAKWLFSIAAASMLASVALADHWTFELLRGGTPRVMVLVGMDVVGIAWDHTSIPPLKDRRGNIVARPYGISVDL
ncbi:MAG: hypothetical protein HYR64_07755 [Fimbriimonas ginsengisoli]|uniref:Uncharacterized protein n=1 Tax=Fimbriimonas ginsengisoli TaxID=1005039 RepID=A0A931LVI3_FIMGI|nr:hypothetical protein [Fimbriimonas ginsengisoli]